MELIRTIVKSNKEPIYKEVGWLYNKSSKDLELRFYNGEGWVSLNSTSSTNNEDISLNIKNELQFADRVYNPTDFSGKGYKILRKNIVNGKNILTQDMINEENTIYEIRYDFDLNKQEITIPNNCILKFEGGVLSNGELNSYDVKFINPNISEDVTINYLKKSYKNQVTLGKKLYDNTENKTIQGFISSLSDKKIELEGKNYSGTISSSIHPYANALIPLKDKCYSIDGDNASITPFGGIIGIGGYNIDNETHSFTYKGETYLANYVTGNISNITKITDQINIGSNIITVADASTFKVNDIIFVRIGTNDYDPRECVWGRPCRIIKIDENKIYIDKNIPISISLESAQNEFNTICKINTYIFNITLDKLNINGNDSSIEAGIWMVAADNCSISNITSINAGAGAVLLCYSNNIQINNLKVSSHEAGHQAKGRCINLYCCENITINNADFSDFKGACIFIEDFCKNIVFNNVTINDTNLAPLEFTTIQSVQGSETFFNNLTYCKHNNSDRTIFGSYADGKILVRNFTLIGKVSSLGIKSNCFSGIFKNIYDGKEYIYNLDDRRKVSVNYIVKDSQTYISFPNIVNKGLVYSIFIKDSNNKKVSGNLYIMRNNKAIGLLTEGDISNKKIYIDFGTAFQGDVNQPFGIYCYNIPEGEQLNLTIELEYIPLDNNIIEINLPNIGTFTDKPNENIPIGFSYFCTDKQTIEGNTDGIVIYYKGDGVWIDALGRVIS